MYYTKRVTYDLRLQDDLHTLWLQAREPDSVNFRIPQGRWLSRRSVALPKQEPTPVRLK